jgi:V8-like Glu-specific endopeptidase
VKRIFSGVRAWSVVTMSALVLLISASCTTSGPLTAFTVGSVATTGPLYFAGTSFHTCTASVLTSPTEDLIITAAHCVYGSGAGMIFVPGSVGGSSPYGRWTVTAAYVDPTWVSSRNPLRDVAILRVAPVLTSVGWRNIQQLTGGNRLVTTPAVIGLVVVPAYIAGVGGNPISCLANTYRSGAYTAFNCGGYPDGVSGAPFIQGSTVLGVIGGLHQGGCSPSISYSSPFDASTIATFNRAVARGVANVLPSPGSDGC